MEEKNVTKISLSTFLLIIAIIAIIVMGIFIYKLNNDKTTAIQKSYELQSQVNNLNGTIGDLQVKSNNISEIANDEKANTSEKNEEKTDTQNNYISNFRQSISKELGEDNMIYLNLTSIDYNDGTGYVSVNNKHEAHIYLSNFKEFSSGSNLKKIADNVVNVWYCEQGQVPGNNYIVFLKEDGSVTYVRFRTTSNGKTNFESEEKTLKGITNISNIVTIEGGDENGIGGVGVLFIKEDGTCLPYSTLDDLIK